MLPAISLFYRLVYFIFLFLLLFFFYCSGLHLDLHSFPTRRSSDLRSYARRSSGEQGVAPVLAGAHAGRRSEEHTSELQSHHDLVCRLLLEKKKTIRAHTKTCVFNLQSIRSRTSQLTSGTI